MRILLLVSMVLLVVTPPQGVSAWWNDEEEEPEPQVENSEELGTKYPSLQNKDRKGNAKILCPFLRMVERSGRFDEDFIKPENDPEEVQVNDTPADGSTPAAEAANKKKEPPKYRIPVDKLKRAVEEFGCEDLTGCGPVLHLVSHGQRQFEIKEENGTPGFFAHLHAMISNPFRIDLERLWASPPVSHDCGFTFEKGHHSVTSKRIHETLKKFEAKQNDDGQLLWDDVIAVKEAICKEEGVEKTLVGHGEAQLLFSYLGGVDRGYVEYSDLSRFLRVHNELPITKAKEFISATYLLKAGSE